MDLKPIVSIPVGGKDNEISMYDDQTGIDFEIIDGNLYLLDDINNSIKVFSMAGAHKFTIKTPDKKIKRIFHYSNLFILLSTPANIVFVSKDGKTVFDHKLNIHDPNFLHAMLYDGYLFLPKIGSNILNETLTAFRLKIAYADTISRQLIEINEQDVTADSYDLKSAFQFFPAEKELYPFLTHLAPSDIAAQSKKYIVFSLNEGDAYVAKIGYYIFLKDERVFKRLGSFLEEVGGENYAGGWGRGHRIYNDSFYVLGAKYSDDEEFRTPINVIISKMDLSNVKNLPSVEPKFQWWK
jgi:hypothetical protein